MAPIVTGRNVVKSLNDFFSKIKRGAKNGGWKFYFHPPF
jgi:hypothetical protein